MYVLTIQ
jgi:glycerol-3-phosphate dehydrogenase